MTKTVEDLPNIMNSISWQLKRIAEELERFNDAQEPHIDENTHTPTRTGNSEMLDSTINLREFLNKCRSD